MLTGILFAFFGPIVSVAIVSSLVDRNCETDKRKKSRTKQTNDRQA